MITIDASQGEGGGQVLRTAISLSSITGKAVTLEGIRGGRAKPGLMRQHLTGVRAAAQITGATTRGAELNSQTLAFEPGPIRAGDYDVAVGTAGSTVLVAQTVLPILAFAGAPSSLTVSGGTHVKWSPSFEFFARSFLPQVGAMGLEARAELLDHGFYPAGGGRIRVDVEPWAERRALALTGRGDTLGLHADVVLANVKPSVGRRELDVLRERLPLTSEELREVESPGGGNCVSVHARYANVETVVTGLGERGVKAERVARDAADSARRYLTSEACAGEYLTDQLLLPCALAARDGHVSTFTATEISLHTRTNIDIIRAFLRVEVETTQTDRRCWTVEIRPSS